MISIDEYIKTYKEVENFLSQELERLDLEPSYDLSHYKSMDRVRSLVKMTSNIENFWEPLYSGKIILSLNSVKSNLESIIEHIT